MTVTTPVVFGANSIAPPALIDSILFALIVKLSTVNVVKSPTLVIAVCAAPVTVAAVPDALPVTLPVNGPANPVAVNIPVLELNVKFVPDFGGNAPVAAVVNNTLHDVSVDSSATVTFVDVVAVAALPVVLPELPDIDGAVIAPDVIVSVPILIDPKPAVIEPVSNAPVVTNAPLPAVGDLPDKSVVKFAIFDCAIAADALILALAILVIELPVASWSIVFLVNVVVESAVTRPVSSAD